MKTIKKRLLYLNVVLTIIAVALTVIVIQNTHVIQRASATPVDRPVDINISHVGGWSIFPGSLPVKISE